MADRGSGQFGLMWTVRNANSIEANRRIEFYGVVLDANGRDVYQGPAQGTFEGARWHAINAIRAEQARLKSVVTRLTGNGRSVP